MTREQARALLIRKVAQRFKVPESHCSIDGELRPWRYGGSSLLMAQVAVRGQGSTSATVSKEDARS